MELKRDLEIGVQIYVNKGDTPEELRGWVRKAHHAGLRIVRVFLFWDIINPRKDVWDFTVYDAIFDEVEKCGMKIVGTMWAVNPPGWMNLTDYFANFGDLNDPEYWSIALDYVEKVAGHFADHPALDSWVSWKEATRPLVKNPNSLRDFRKWLKDHYKEIENLNKVWFNQSESFETVGLKPGNAIQNHKHLPNSLDWERFMVDNLCEKLRDIYNTIRKKDKVHPIYVNPHNTGLNMLSWGQDPWKDAKEADFLGLSNHIPHNAMRIIQSPYKFHQYIAYQCDIIKSATPDPNGFYEVTEMHAGPTIMTGHLTLTPSAADIQHYTWEAIGSGASRVIYWVLNWRKSGHEPYEWSLSGADGTSTYRLDELTKITDIIKKHQALFDAAKPKDPDVYILYSTLSWQLAEWEGGTVGFVRNPPDDPNSPRNTMYAPDGMCGAYQMLSDLGLTVKFISEEKIINGELPSNAVLVAPSCMGAEEKLYGALDGFVKNGGTLIADFMFAMKNKYGFIPDPPKSKDVLDRIFGGVLYDIISDPNTFELNDGKYMPEGWFLRISFKPGSGEVLARDAEGAPVILRNSYGKGTAIRIGTTFFQRYMTKPLKKNLNYLHDLLPQKLFTGIHLSNPDGELRLREMISADKRILILLNSSEKAAKAVLDFDGTKGKLISLSSDETHESDGISAVLVSLNAGEVKQFVL
ncbi:beta-galactosidase [Spirochaetia bacterium]|nr:beta-galactosidase [Spirochaetia bacterium]